MESPWLSPQEAADYLGVSRSTIYRLVKSGDLKIIKVRKLSKISKDDLDKLMEESKKGDF